MMSLILVSVLYILTLIVYVSLIQTPRASHGTDIERQFLVLSKETIANSGALLGVKFFDQVRNLCPRQKQLTYDIFRFQVEAFKSGRQSLLLLPFQALAILLSSPSFPQEVVLLVQFELTISRN